LKISSLFANQDFPAYQIGQVIIDRFEVLSKPVPRSLGLIYLAKDRKQGLKKILFYIPQSVTDDSEALTYIREEVSLIRWLNHSLIARLYDVHQDGPSWFLELEFVRGKTLKQKKLEKSDKRLSENIVRWLGIQILDALEYAHDHNVLHRDIKPKNVVLAPDGKVTLIDFGISEMVRVAASMVWDTSTHTTILYMSPEQLSGKQLSIPSDIYSLGATLYDLVSGHPPFHRGDVYTQILREKAKPVGDISSGLNQVLLKCLSKEPWDRFRTAAEMRQALSLAKERYFSKEPVSASSVPKKVPGSRNILVRRDKPTKSTNPTYKFLIIVFLLILVMGYLLHKMNSIAPSGKETVPSVGKTPVTTRPDTFRVRLYQALLRQAEEKMKNGYLYLPTGNNALELYKQAFRIKPNDTDVFRKIKNIKKRALQDIQKAIKTDSPGKALEISKALDKLLANDPAYLTVKKEIERKVSRGKIRIAILNGMGEKGIAHQLEKILTTAGYRVTYVENYRPGGKLNWRVAQTFVMGNHFPDRNIKKLNQLLGRKYDFRFKLPLPDHTVNYVLVLGADYQRLLDHLHKSLGNK